jgi:hypothetical protein
MKQLHELKYDGYRLIVEREGDRVRLFRLAGPSKRSLTSAEGPRSEIACAHAARAR